MFNRVSESVMCWDSEEPWWSSFGKSSPHVTLMVCCEGPATLNSTTSAHSLDYPTEKNPANIPGGSPDSKAGSSLFSVAFLKHKLSVSPITFWYWESGMKRRKITLGGQPGGASGAESCSRAIWPVRAAEQHGGRSRKRGQSVPTRGEWGDGLPGVS